MTIKEISSKFKIDEKVIRQSIKDGLIEADKTKRPYILSDDLKFIPIKKQLQAFLFQVLKYKNNPNIALNRSMCQNNEQLNILLEYLFKKGFVSKWEICEDICCSFTSIMLTDDGIDFAVGEKLAQKRLGDFNLTFNFNAGCINV